MAERLTLLQKARYVFSCIEELNEKLVNLEEIINNDGKQRFQITKSDKNYIRLVTLMLASFEYVALAITGNGNYENLLKSI